MKVTNETRRKVFKMAWAAVKNNGISLSKALKWAWKKVKESMKSIIIKNIIRETEKAIAIEAKAIDAKGGRVDLDILIWIPKSLVKDGKVPVWFMDKKLREQAERLHAALVILK